MTFSWSESLDLCIRILPALSIVAAILLAKGQLAASKQDTAVKIAKNHFRETLELLFTNADLLYDGASPAAFEKLKTDDERYKRYRMLWAVTGFALQELYFVVQDDENFMHTIKCLASLFGPFLSSNRDFPPDLQKTLNPVFWNFLVKNAVRTAHPAIEAGLVILRT